MQKYTEKTLLQQMMSSQQEFRNQFDPNSNAFHKGLNIPVPIGGSRIPESMNREYPENFDPNYQGPTKQQYGEQYLKTQKTRQNFLILKKILAKLNPVVEAIYRHDLHFREKADKQNEQHIAIYKANIQKQQTQLKAVNKQLEATIIYLTTFGETYKEFQKQLQIIIKQSFLRHQTKQSLSDFGFKVKRVSAKVFSQAQKLLEVMKKIKKNYNTSIQTK